MATLDRASIGPALRSQWIPLLTLGLYTWAFLVEPENARQALAIGATTFASVLLLIFAVFGLVGLMQVWVSRNTIVKLLGKDSGLKGLLIAALCGTLLIGPAYIVFPLLMSLQRQGARWAVIVIVLSAYAVKLHLIPFETQFLGLPFSLGRSLLTVILAIPAGLLIERLMPKDAGRGTWDEEREQL